MIETNMSSSGEFKQYLDGDLVHDINFAADYDGDVLDAELSINDQQYYTQLDNDTPMELLNYPNNNNNNESLIVRLQQDFPLNEIVVAKTKKREIVVAKTKKREIVVAKTKKREKREKRAAKKSKKVKK
jgi:hypothetical protein